MTKKIKKIFKYRTTEGTDAIAKIRIIRETPRFVVLPDPESLKGERQAAKRTSYHCYHATWLDAYEFLQKIEQDRLTEAEHHMYQAKARIRNLEYKYKKKLLKYKKYQHLKN